MQKVFECQNCHYKVKTTGNIGTKNRNHCPKCLFSKHVDNLVAGDRKSECKELMEPVGLTFKKSRIDKYGKEIKGELMLVHRCKGCNKVSINRIAADDDSNDIVNLLGDFSEKQINGISLLTKRDKAEVEKQLFGN